LNSRSAILFDVVFRVIDFKFTETQEKQHVEQVQLYMQWLRAMHFPEVSGFLVYGFTKEVVPC